MVHVLLPWVLAVAVGAAGALVGLAADRFATSALLLHAEPLLLVLAVWGIAVLRWRGRPALSVGLAVGTVAAVAAVRLPLPIVPASAEPPAWSGPVGRCAAALDAPVDPVRLLQWTLDGHEDPATVRAVVAAAEANVVVLHGADPAVVGGALESTGGESRMYPGVDGVPATAIVAAGGFHPCGETLEWSDAMDTPEGYALSFVGVPPSTVFPLVVTRFPGPLPPGDWGARMSAATDRVVDAIAGLQGASTVLVADAPAPRTYRHLDGRMAAVGLASVPVPPSWPARVGPVPLLTLHPYGRMWAGPIWRVTRTSRVLAPEGTHAPVLAVLEGPRRPAVDGAGPPDQRIAPGE
ncbi:MAG: hypothetical protein ACK4YP_05180 [Myxococcota bacterium]